MKKKLLALLAFLPEGKGLTLGEDTFLCTGGLDGSDKIYGFIKEDGEILVISRSSSGGYPVNDMDKADLDYIFKGSALINGKSIADKLEKVSVAYKSMKYEVVDSHII